MTALAVLEQLELAISPEQIMTGLKSVQLSGRFQQINCAPRVIVDVAHNPHAAALLAKRIAELPVEGACHAVVGMLHDKDIGGTLKEMIPQVDHWHLASLSGPRAASCDELASYLGQQAHYCHASVEKAYQSALVQAKDEDLVIVFGSFFTVAELLARRK